MKEFSTEAEDQPNSAVESRERLTDKLPKSYIK